MKIKIDSIIVNERMRDLNEDKANEIASSIKEIGLINPITINQKNELVAGMHRLRAFQLLGYTEIEANVITLEGLKQELAEIDENLIRNDLHYIDKGEHFKRRKEIYEMLYPETKREATLKQYRSAESAERTEPSFVDDTANKTGISSRVIHEELQIANKLEPEVKKQVKEMDLPKSDALELARMQPEKQMQIIEQAKKEKGKVKEAIKIVKKEEQKEERRAESQKAIADLPEMPERYQIIHGDFREQNIEPNSIDLIITDPPYLGEFLPLWKDLASFAKKVLKPSGFLVTYSGQLHLPQVIAYLSEQLGYYWVICLIHKGSHQLVFPRNILCEWKPVLIFQKSPTKKIEVAIPDSITNDIMEKQLHDWQQGIDGVSKLIKMFSKEGDTILDPFAGSGTTLIASLKNNRKGIAIEKEEEHINTIRNRVYELQK